MTDQTPKPASKPERRRRPRHGPRRPQVNPFGDRTARGVAYDIITRSVRAEDRFEQVWDQHPGLAQLPPRDRALATHLAFGVLRRLHVLDARAIELTDGKFHGLIPPVQWILRLGLFQVQDCDRIQPHAAVSTAVEAAKNITHQGIAGLVNAVLRRAVREREAPPAEPPHHARTVADRLSMPEWLVDILFARYGQEHSRDIGRWANSIPHLFIRLAKDGPGLTRLDELLVEANLNPGRPHHEFPEYVCVDTAALVRDSQIFKEPIGWVQNPAAGLVVRLLDPQPGEEVLDLFAAPGGKTLAISEAVGPEGKVLAVDRSPERLKRLIENRERFNAANILPIEGDVARLGDRMAMRVLADAPCSALGTLPKNPEVRWTKSPEDIDRLSRSQRVWLGHAARHASPGGVLVYATCTITGQENEDVAQDFLDRNPDFTLESAKGFVPDRYVTSGGCLATNPPVDGLDGVFAARFRRKPSDAA